MMAHNGDPEAIQRQWAQDCLQYYPEVLHGKYTHYCWSEWDGLPIDETCVDEFAVCTCGFIKKGETK
jgi:hypothetical protein